MAEIITLNSPFKVDPRESSNLKVEVLKLDWKGKNIEIHLGDGNIQKKVEYTGETAETFMIALNKANLSTKSLHKRIMERLVTDGHIEGTITGSPD